MGFGGYGGVWGVRGVRLLLLPPLTGSPMPCFPLVSMLSQHHNRSGENRQKTLHCEEERKER